MGLLLARGIDDFLRRQADALVDHLHAGIARAHRDLLGAVGMAVEPGLADQEGQAATELAGYPVDVGADVVEPADVVAHGAADAGRRAVFAERFAQRPAPFAGGDAGLGAGDRGWHYIAAAGGGAFQFAERRRNRVFVARRTPGDQPLELVAFGILRHRHDRIRRRR